MFRLVCAHECRFLKNIYTENCLCRPRQRNNKLLAEMVVLIPRRRNTLQLFAWSFPCKRFLNSLVNSIIIKGWVIQFNFFFNLPHPSFPYPDPLFTHPHPHKGSFYLSHTHARRRKHAHTDTHTERRCLKKKSHIRWWSPFWYPEATIQLFFCLTEEEISSSC